MAITERVLLLMPNSGNGVITPAVISFMLGTVRAGIDRSKSVGDRRCALRVRSQRAS